VVVAAVNLGQGAALQTGIDYALSQGATHIVTFDADGQHDAADIQRSSRPRRTRTLRSAPASWDTSRARVGPGAPR
jgi:glycosyltransferase involved in cell wall biosynthesis